MVTAAGPALQFAFGVMLIILTPNISIPEGSLFLPFIEYLIWVSIAWSILNCLPVHPMDGGQMMAAILGPNKRHYVHLISSIAAVAVGIAGYLFLGAILLPIFMALFAWQNWQSYQASSPQ